MVSSLLGFICVVPEALGLTNHGVCLYFGIDPPGLETSRRNALTPRPGAAIRFGVFASRVRPYGRGSRINRLAGSSQFVPAEISSKLVHCERQSSTTVALCLKKVVPRPPARWSSPSSAIVAESYDAALRREEILALEPKDIDAAHRLLRDGESLHLPPRLGVRSHSTRNYGLSEGIRRKRNTFTIFGPKLITSRSANGLATLVSVPEPSCF